MMSAVIFEKIFKKVGIEPSRAIVIEDRPIFIENALNTGAYVIQACATGEYPIQYPFYVEKMNELPDIIDNLLETLKV